ncbi:MAG: LacI family DNA-binding transcriptional regulator [Trebonia sp.]
MFGGEVATGGDETTAPSGHAEVSRERRPRRATIRDVAESAGVSIGTASKALNGQGRLRAETIERVLRAAQRLGFAPNTLAQALLAGRSFTVGLITTDSFGRFSIPVMLGAEDALGTGQVSVFMCDTRDDPERERRYVEMLWARRVDGLIVTGRRIEPRPPVHALPGIPVVYAMTQPAADPADGVGGTARGPAGPTSSGGSAGAVLPDDEGGGFAAGSHLLAIGRRRIAHVAGPGRFLAARLRARGFSAALASAGLQPCGEIRFGEWSEHWGREAAGLLLADRPDAIFCGSDQIARGVADTLRAVGRRVPDDVALVGFDNWLPMVMGALPPLTSVDPCLEEVGRVAATRLLAAIGGEHDAAVQRVPASLAVRESTGGYPAPAGSAQSPAV